MASRLRVAVLTISIVALSLSVVGAEESADVTAAFSSYKSAILGGDGKAAVAALSAATFEYYEQMRDLALYGSEEEVKALSALDMMQALMLRTRIKPKRLKDLSGRELVVLAVDSGWIGKSSAARVDIGDVTLDGHSASATVLNRGRPTTQSVAFAKEDGVWKFDLTSLFDQSSAAFELMAKGQGGSTADFVLNIVQTTSGEPVNQNIWQAPFERPADSGSER